MDPATIAIIVTCATSAATLFLVVGLRLVDGYLLGRGFTHQQLAPLESEINALEGGIYHVQPLATVNESPAVIAAMAPTQPPPMLTRRETSMSLPGVNPPDLKRQTNA